MDFYVPPPDPDSGKGDVPKDAYCLLWIVVGGPLIIAAVIALIRLIAS